MTALRRLRSLLLCVFLLIPVLSAAESGAPETAGPAVKAVTSLDDLAGAEIGVQTGMICDVLAQQRIPGCRIQYYNVLLRWRL